MVKSDKLIAVSKFYIMYTIPNFRYVCGETIPIIYSTLDYVSIFSPSPMYIQFYMYVVIAIHVCRHISTAYKVPRLRIHSPKIVSLDFGLIE